ncbi:hypothetical protein [Antarcticirhabdus aurantiaca]|uniref:hypothetical protein n=1 Tax=Antarcticirhabdus aurantiaca TaxID=2606717 RepID=UPI00131BE146|nr:hypothetical protein [Antarcticirhabdus aurantiaca]
MLLTPPSASNGYHVTAEHELSDELLNAIFGDVHVRLVVLEAVKLDAQLAIDQVLALSAETVVATLAEEIAAGRAGLAQTQSEFAELREEYEALQAGGLFAARIQVQPITGYTVANVQQALEAIAGRLDTLTDRFNAQRQINMASVFFAGQ